MRSGSKLPEFSASLENAFVNQRASTLTRILRGWSKREWQLVEEALIGTRFSCAFCFVFCLSHFFQSVIHPLPIFREAAHLCLPSFIYSFLYDPPVQNAVIVVFPVDFFYSWMKPARIFIGTTINHIDGPSRPVSMFIKIAHQPYSAYQAPRRHRSRLNTLRVPL